MDCKVPAVATGCNGVVRDGDTADAAAAASSSAASHLTAQLGFASESLYAEHPSSPPLFIL